MVQDGGRMTNGEKIMQMFPRCKEEFRGCIARFIIDGYAYEFSKSWWNDEYQEPVVEVEE